MLIFYNAAYCLSTVVAVLATAYWKNVENLQWLLGEILCTI